MNYLIVSSFPILFIVCIFFVMIIDNRKKKVIKPKFFIFSIVTIFIEYILSVLDVFIPNFTEKIWLRITLSYLCYILKPLALMFYIFVIEENVKTRLLLAIPAMINGLILLGAFFGWKAVFGYNEEYVFVRGPLGYSAFIIPAVYVVLLFVFVSKKISLGGRSEFTVLMGCSVLSLVSVLSDVFIYGRNSEFSIAASTVIYYAFLNSYNHGKDVLTKLFNRERFYLDIEWKDETICAIASADMNGLKEVNDQYGHSSGDKALAMIGEVMAKVVSKNVMCYRVGGDEFNIIFRKMTEDDVKSLIEKILNETNECGVSLSVGYSYRSNLESVSQLCKECDLKMYEEKKKYYERTGYDRRSVIGTNN